MVTPRRRGPPAAPPPPPQPAPPALTTIERQMIKGDKGDPGATGPRGPSALLEISESGSTELYGAHAHGFACIASGAAPLQCSFSSWDPGDILQIEFWVQLGANDPDPGSLLAQAQISTNGGSEWHGVTGSRARIASQTASTSSSCSVALPMPEGASPPLVRLHVSHTDKHGPDYGPGPEGATLLLRCTRWLAGTYSPVGKLTPPRH